MIFGQIFFMVRSHDFDGLFAAFDVACRILNEDLQCCSEEEELGPGSSDLIDKDSKFDIPAGAELTLRIL